MKHLRTFLGTSIIVASVWLMIPTIASAHSIDFVSVSPEVVNNITPNEDEKGAEENFYTYWFIGKIGQTYTATFNVSDEPAMTFVSGGLMDLDDNISYDAEAGQFTVTYTAVPLQQIDSQSEQSWEDDETLTVVAISFPVEEGENGPGENMIGSWMSTHFQEWTLLTPNDNGNQLGAAVSGDPGDSGTFRMFVSPNAMNDMGEQEGFEEGEMTADNMAYYEDGELVSGDVESAGEDNATYIDFETTLPEESDSDNDDNNNDEEGQEDFIDCDGDGQPDEGTEENPDENEDGDPCAEASLSSYYPAEGPGVTQTSTAAPREPVSLLANKAKVKKGGKVKFTGWIRSGEAGQKIKIQRRIGKKKFKNWKTVTTTTGGKFTVKSKVNKALRFRARSQKKTSEIVQVKLK